MTDYLMMGDLARWEVMWVTRKEGKPRIVCIEFENDLPGALDLYMKAKRAKKPMATLRCCNVGFPPPEKLRPYYEEQITRVERVYSRKRKKWMKKVTRETVEVVPLDKLNREKGVWWCPYCRELRRFQHWDGFMSGDGWFNVLNLSKPLWVPSPGMYCPMCGINQNDSHVRRWNPQAPELVYRYKQRSRRGRRRR